MRTPLDITSPANELAQEEISRSVSDLYGKEFSVTFSDSGRQLQVEGPSALPERDLSTIQSIAERTARALQSLHRTVVFQTQQTEILRTNVDLAGVHFPQPGVAILEGLPLALYRYFDRLFEEMGEAWGASSILPSSLIAPDVLVRNDYLRAFPQHLTVAGYLHRDPESNEYHDASEFKDACKHIEVNSCLSPAICYHVFKLFENQRIGPGIVRGIAGKCFRFESGAMQDLRRLREFTMREVVFLGSEKDVLNKRDQSMSDMAEVLKRLELLGSIRTASDPFFVSSDSLARTYFQLRSDTKFEVSLLLPHKERLAAGSHNYHSTHFGRAFQIFLEEQEPAHSACVAFGIERWVYAFLAQHGTSIELWPECVRIASEIRALTSKSNCSQQPHIP